MFAEYRLRRRIRRRSRELADNWIEGVTVGDRRSLERLIYETLCKDHGIRP